MKTSQPRPTICVRSVPIYKAAYDLCLWLEQVVRGFSRYHKYTLGTDLRDGSRRILRLVVLEGR